MAETKAKKNKPASAESSSEAKKEVSKYAAILKAPRVTEKANLLMQNNVYVFEIASTSGKKEVMKAVKDIHKVTPIRVNIVSANSKGFVIRGKRATKAGVKKAYVYLKQGDKIQ